MKKAKSIAAAILTFACLTTGAKEVTIDKNTKKIVPTKSIGVFEPINWDQLEERQDQGKKDSIDFKVMVCDDTYLSVVEIEFEGTIGQDIRAESDDCKLEGGFENGWETTLHFNGPETGSSCTITIEKQQNGKRIRKHFEIASEC